MAKIKGITVQIGADTTGLDAALKDVNKTSREISKELREVERLLKFNPHNTEVLAQKQKLLADQVENAREKLSRLKDVQAQVNQQFQEGKISEEQYRAFQRELIKTESQLREYEKALKEVNLQNHEFNQRMQEMGEKLQDVGKQLTDVGKTLSTRLTAPLTALGAVSAKMAVDFESAFAGVRKTVDATEEEFAALAEGIREMAKEIPAAATEIAGVAEAAGQLGIQNEHILSFTRTMIDLGESTNMSAEEAATALARFANIVQMPQDQFDRLGSTVVALGNNLATTEAEIVNMGLRLAGAGKQVGMTEAEILSLAGALSSVGIEAQAGGSAFSKVMVQMQLAVETGGEALSNFASVAGMSTSQFRQAFQEDAAGALIAFIQGLQTAEERGMSAIKILDDMGITEVRLRDALLRAAGAGDLFAESIQLGTQAWEENTALTNEAAQRYETTASKLEIMRNRLQDVAITFGEILLPPLVAVAEKVGDFADWLGSLDPKIKTTIVVVGGLAAALGPVLIVLGQIVSSIGTLMPLLGTLAAFIKTTLIPAIMGISWPVVAVVAGIAALAAVAYEVYRAWDEVKTALSATWEYMKASAERLALNISLSFERMKHAVINAVGEILERLSVLENLPFGIGDKFAGLKDKVGESVDGSKQKIAELEAALEANSVRMAEAVDGMKVSWGDVGAKVAEDVKAVTRAITGQTEAYAEELGEQTDIITEETEAQTAQVRRAQQAQTAIISKEAKKQEEERAKFEEQWNQKLFDLQATRREKLQAEYDAAIELAKKLEADTFAIHKYYRILFDQMDEEEQKAKEERLETWRERLKEATASELDLLVLQRDRQLALIEDQMQEELELAGDNEEAKTQIMQFWALKRQQVLGEYADAVKAIQEQEAEWLQSLEDRLIEATATEEELLAHRRDKRLSEIRAQMEEELKMAKGNEEAIASITEYWLAEGLKAHEEYNDALRALQEQRVEQLQTWTDMLFELTASEEDLLRRSGERQIAEVEARAAQALEVFKDDAEATEAIIRARDAKIEQITKDTNDKLAALEQEKIKRKETLHSEWYDKLAELTLSEEELLTKSANERIAMIEKAAEEAIKAAEGDAELIAIIEQSKVAQILAINEQLNEDLVALERTRLQQQESILKSWQDTLFDFQATEEDRLRKQAEDKLAALEKQAEADKKRLQEVGAAAEALQQIEDNLAEARRLVNQQLNQDLEALANQRVQREEDILRSWQDVLFDLYASEEDRMRKQATDRIEQLRKRAEAEIELVKDNAEAVEYIEGALAEAIRQINEQLANDLKALEDRKLQEQEDRLKSWQDRLFEATASEEELLRKRAGDRIAELERIAAKEIELAGENAELRLAIEQATAAEIRKIRKELADSLAAPREAFEKEWADKLFELSATPEMRLERLREEAREMEQLAIEIEASAETIEAIQEYYAIKQQEIADEIAENQKTTWQKIMDGLQPPLETFINAVANAAGTLLDVVKAITSGNWVNAFLSIIMETEAFAKAMELLGAVLQPVVALFDAVLAPIINFLLKLWNGIIDALSKISIFGWRPFGGLADKKIKLPGEDDGGGSGTGRGGGRQVSEITGPTRDLLTDLLSPLAHLGQIVAPIQDIRQILYERLPNFNTLDFAGAGAIGGDIVFEAGAIVINSSGTSATELSRDMLDAIEREMARRINFGVRGRGGR